MKGGWKATPRPRSEISTARLELVGAEEGLAEAVAAFYRENRAHLIPWSPPYSEDLESVSSQQSRLRQSRMAFIGGTAWKWFLYDRQDPAKIAGFVHYSQIVRGAMQSSMLGYGLAEWAQGKGLMTEALEATLVEVFGDRGRLHRVQANVVPTNVRSLALLDRLGFQREGVAPQYLFIFDEWKDHVLCSKINEQFDPKWLP